MRIDLIGANLASNAYGRTYLLAKVLARRHSVRVLGPLFGADRIWPPCDDGSLEVISLPGRDFPAFWSDMRRLAGRVDADLTVAVKPRPASYGVALMARRRQGTPILLDIDDWDLAGVYGRSRTRILAGELARARSPYSNLWLRMLGARAGRADAVSVVSRELQTRFGGSLLPHGRDTAALDPARFDRAAARATLGLPPDGPLVMFLGTPRPHKGLEALAEAVAGLADIGARLAIVGADAGDPYAASLQHLAGPRLQLLGMRPWSEIGATLAAADAVALPQADLPFTRAQVPAKVFDAMAMARPVVATAVGDLPEILEGCGLLVPSGDGEGLRDALRQLLTDAELAGRLGAAARQRAIQRYSWDAMAPVLEGLLDRAFARHGRPRPKGTL
jgi:glycosyltransferase involved in cell wall biosynthesis